MSHDPLALGSFARAPKTRREVLKIAGIGAAALAAAPLLNACGSSSGSSSASPGAGERTIIRFAFAPDPVWDYMNDNGMITDWEAQYNTRIVTSSSWDEFTYFAGGHGDIVSMATYEMPILEQKTGFPTSTFGRYNLLRITPLAQPSKNYNTLADIPKGSKIGVPSAVSSTLVWGMFAKKLHNLDFRVGGGDFELIVADHFVMPQMVVSGDLEAALAIPEAAVPQMRKGELIVMYDGQLPWQVYSGIIGEEHQGVMGNNFSSKKEWFDANSTHAQEFNALWESGIQAWRGNMATIVKTYPQHFSVEDPADVEFMIKYVTEHDWFTPSVYFDETWATNEKKLYDLMKETGFMEQNAPVPEFDAIAPPAGANPASPAA
jgi:hypothetical protein